MGAIYTERKNCKCCGKAKMIATTTDTCSICKMEQHDLINSMIQAFCLGKPLGV